MSSLTTSRLSGAPRVAKKSDGSPSDGKAINFRAPKRLAERLEHVADALGLDVSNLIRMVLSENLAEYEQRAEEALRTSPKNDP